MSSVGLDDIPAGKTERIDRAIYLATRMQEKAVAHTELVAKYNDPDSDVTWEAVKASSEVWVEYKRDLRDFLAVVIDGER
jgi:hypothetical protein